MSSGKNDAKEHIHKLGDIMLEQLNFCLRGFKWKLPAAFCRVSSFLMYSSFRQSAVMPCPRYRNSFTQLSSSFQILTAVEYRPLDCFGRTSIHTVFVVLHAMSWGPACTHIPPRVSRAVTMGAWYTCVHVPGAVAPAEQIKGAALSELFVWPILSSHSDKFTVSCSRHFYWRVD